MPDAAPSVSRYRRSWSHDLLTTAVSTSSWFFSTRQWFAFVPLPRSHLTRISLPGLFLLRSPPRSLEHSSGRWFESCSCQPVRGTFPHQPYSYAKPSNQLRCSVLLMTQLERKLQGKLYLSRITRGRQK